MTFAVTIKETVPKAKTYQLSEGQKQNVDAYIQDMIKKNSEALKNHPMMQKKPAITQQKTVSKLSIKPAKLDPKQLDLSSYFGKPRQQSSLERPEK